MYAKVEQGQFITAYQDLPKFYTHEDGSVTLGDMSSWSSQELKDAGLYPIEEVNASYDPVTQDRSDPVIEVLSDKVTYTYIVTDKPAPEPIPQEKLDLAFFRKTDWIILRHLEEERLGVPTTLKDTDFLALLQERNDKVKLIDAGQAVEDAGGVSIAADVEVLP